MGINLKHKLKVKKNIKFFLENGLIIQSENYF